MYLLYLDDSGSTKNASDKHVILAGLAVFERQPHWFSERLDRIAKDLLPSDWENLEFRGADIFAGKKQWRYIDKVVRRETYEAALNLLSTSQHAFLFGAAIHKAAISPDDPIEYAFEQICNRFDRFLGRLYRNNNTQRGLIVLDESSYETSLQRLSKEFRTIGHRWGQLYNMAEVPLFVNSKASRMVQFADLVAYSMRRYYEHSQTYYLESILRKFDAEGGVLHGLLHYTPQGSGCNCLACRQKRSH